MHICIVTVALLHLCTILHPLRATTSICANFLSILQENPTFSILYTYFYKTLISVYLFYHLFYLNNHFLTFFFILFYPKLSLSTHETLSIPTKTLLSETPLHHGHSPIQAPRLADPSSDTHQATSADPLSLSLLCVRAWVCLIFWLIFYFVSVGVCVSEEERRWWGREFVSFVDVEEREKKGAKLEIIKILNAKATVTVHICTVTVAIMHFYTHWYGCFLVKMCKMKCFFYFARFCMSWCSCSDVGNFFCHNV